MNTFPAQAPTPPAHAPALSSADESLHLLIDGMSCASCVTRVERALAGVAGVARARVNLAERSALVMGTPAPEALLAAVQQAGYGAEVIQDEDVRRQRQQQTAAQATRRFSWQSALALGVPLIVWGLMGGSMALTPACPGWR